MSHTVIYRTASNFEHKAARELEQHGIPAAVPYDDSGKRKRVTAPGYVFAGRELHAAFVKHVGHKVGTAKIDEIARLYVLKPRAITPDPLKVGDHVKIKVGPFADKAGPITAERGRKAWSVDLSTHSMGTVTVHTSNLIRIDPG